MMDLESGFILHSETVDKIEVALQSPNIKKEAYVCSVCYLLHHMWPDLQKPGTILQTNVSSIKHYKTWYKKRVYKKTYRV